MVKKFDQDTKILKFDRIKILNFCKIKYTIFELKYKPWENVLTICPNKILIWRLNLCNSYDKILASR